MQNHCKCHEVCRDCKAEPRRMVFISEVSTQAGNVRYNDETNCIFVKVHNGYEYDIDLDRCQTPGAALDWLHQVNGKIWGREHMADVVELLFNNIPSSWWSGKA